ncbi:hypothetical protein B484DRAFT_334441, partial [Ochromonadaceae sp. CCMP2298]
WGTVGVCVLLAFKYLLRLISDVNLVPLGMLGMIICCAIIYAPTTPETTFYASIAVTYGIAYPIGHTALIGIFSKVLKGPQGKMLGYFGSAGSLARVIFPILAGVLTDLYNDGTLVGLKRIG